MSRLALKDFAARMAGRNNKGFEKLSKSVEDRNKAVYKRTKMEYQSAKKELETENLLDKTAELKKQVVEKRKDRKPLRKLINSFKENKAPPKTGQRLKKSPVSFSKPNNNVIKQDANWDKNGLDDRLTLGVQRRR